MNPDKLPTDSFFNKLRKKEYARLDQQGHIYLDYTGGNIHPQSLVDMHYRYLKNAVYGNPHSTNPTSLLSGQHILETRKKVLEFFNARDYYCVFTSNATGALQIIGECYPFTFGSPFLLTADNHNSVNGIREYCWNKGGEYTYAPINFEDLTIDAAALNNHLSGHSNKKNKLFAFPAQSNVSGVQHSLSWIKKAQDLGWDVLLDAAAFVPGSTLDLSAVQPDFVSISFYKIFGYPTGIGCLLIKKSTFSKLEKPWFAGGTVTVASTRYNGYFLREDHEKFENGTVNYLNIPAVGFGLDYITHISMEKINARIKELSRLFLEKLLPLTHDNGLSLVKLYGPGHTEDRGATFLLNFFDEYGQQFPFQYIEQLANAEKISLRTGCFCNPGIDELNNDISATQLKEYFTSRDHGDISDMMEFLDKMRGAVRISLGLPTTTADISAFIRFVKKLLNTTAPQHVPVSRPVIYGE